MDPRRYGADPNRNPDNVVATTTAVQTAIDVAYRTKSMLWIGSGCDFYCNTLSLTLTGNRTNDGLRIMGSAVNGSRLTFNPAAAAGLTLNGSTPERAPQESPVTLENFSIICSGKRTDALVLNGIAGWTIRRMYIGGANRSIYLHSALTGAIEDCWLSGGNYGIYARTHGAGAPPNLLRIAHNCMSGHSLYAVDYDTGSELHLIGNDIEENGTEGNPASGAIHIGAQINCAPKFGFAKIWMENNWLEANTGGWAVRIEAPALQQQTHISIRGGHIIASRAGQALNVLGASYLLLEDLYSPTPGDTWNLTAHCAALRNALASSIADSGVVYPTYQNVATSTQLQPNGRRDMQVLSLTGIANAPRTGNVLIHQQGNEVTLDFTTPIVGESDSAKATLTGLPPRYWPAVDAIGALMVQDRGVNSIRPCCVAAATGAVILGYGQDLTKEGTKGVIGGSLRYRRS